MQYSLSCLDSLPFHLVVYSLLMSFFSSSWSSEFQCIFSNLTWVINRDVMWINVPFFKRFILIVILKFWQKSKIWVYKYLLKAEIKYKTWILVFSSLIWNHSLLFAYIFHKNNYCLVPINVLHLKSLIFWNDGINISTREIKHFGMLDPVFRKVKIIVPCNVRTALRNASVLHFQTHLSKRNTIVKVWIAVTLHQQLVLKTSVKWLIWCTWNCKK